MEIVKEERINIIILNAKTVSAVLSAPADASAVRTAVILTHGAGGDMNFKALVSLSHALASNGLLCLRFTCKSLNLAHRVKVYRVVWEYLKDLERFTIRNIFFAVHTPLQADPWGRGQRLLWPGSSPLCLRMQYRDWSVCPSLYTPQDRETTIARGART
ncbi:hypothetical protein UPYG_G00158130 [Umbra pygmaea]|uniref:Testis expressed 30 n=1 Tax=Umbra pygmaea TaxID=75934 RepID=A0ABD0WYP3_UMBPY